jgi:hypothetical protein
VLFVEQDKSKKNEMARMIDDHIKRIMVDLGLTVKEHMHPLIRATHYLKGRFALYEPAFIKIIDYVKMNDTRSGEILEEIHDVHTAMFKGLIDVVFDLEPKTNKLYNNYRERNLKALEEAQQHMGNSDKLFKENQEILQNWEEEKNSWNLEKSRLLKDIAALEGENKKYLNMILKHSKSRFR